MPQRRGTFKHQVFALLPSWGRHRLARNQQPLQYQLVHLNNARFFGGKCVEVVNVPLSVPIIKRTVSTQFSTSAAKTLMNSDAQTRTTTTPPKCNTTNNSRRSACREFTSGGSFAEETRGKRRETRGKRREAKRQGQMHKRSKSQQRLRLWLLRLPL